MAHRYASLALLRNRLNVTDDNDRDLAFENALDVASRWVENHTRRRFYATTETRYYTSHWHYPREQASMAGDFPWGNPERPGGGGRASERLAIDDFLSVSAVATDDDGDGVYETTWTVNTDYWLGPRNAVADGKPFRSINRNLVTGRYTFPPYANAIEVIGSSGYSATVPDPIVELTLMVAEVLSRPVLDLTINGVSAYKLGDQLQVTMDSKELPSMGRQILQDYRDPVFQ